MSRSSKVISAEDIWLHTDNGLRVFEREIGGLKVGKKIKHPLLLNDTNASTIVKQSGTSGLFYIVDHGEDMPVMNAITFVCEKYGLSYKEAIDRIAWDFGLSNNQISGRKVDLVETTPTIKIVEPILYEFEEVKFKQKHHLYWNQGELSEDFLRKNNIFAASKIAINKNTQVIPSDELCFVYVAEDLPYGQLKILRIGPNVPIEQKWRTNIGPNYLFYEYEIDPRIPVFIAKSNKDALINKLAGYQSVSVMSENAQNFIETYKNLLIKYPTTKFYLNWGTDKDALNKTNKIRHEVDIQAFKLPTCLAKEGINDNFEFVKYFGLVKYKEKVENFLYLQEKNVR